MGNLNLPISKIEIHHYNYDDFILVITKVRTPILEFVDKNATLCIQIKVTKGYAEKFIENFLKVHIHGDIPITAHDWRTS
jgi:hypothetical protein